MTVIIFMAGLLVLQIAAVALLVVVFVSDVISSSHGAPFVPIKKKLVARLLQFGGLSPQDIFYDLGSGDGRVLRAAVGDFHVVRAVGYEVSWWPYIKSRFILRSETGIIKTHRGSFFDANLSEATFVYMYLFPKLVNKLAEKIARECAAGTSILCPSFPIDLDKHPKFQLLKSEKIATITTYLYIKK